MRHRQQIHSQCADSHLKLRQIQERLRRNQVESVKSRLRYLHNEDEILCEEKESNFVRMNEGFILDAISHYREHETMDVEFEQITLFIKITPSFSTQFGSRLLTLIMQHHKLRTDIYFLDLALSVAKKCQTLKIVNSTNIQKFVYSLLEEKVQVSTLVQLLCVILVKEESKRDVLQAIQDNWLSLRQLGILDNCFLKLAALCCNYGLCLIRESDIIYYLNLEYMLHLYNNLALTSDQIYYLCKIVCTFFTLNKAAHLHADFLSWISTMNNLNLVGSKDKQDMFGVVLFMFERLQQNQKQELAASIVRDSDLSELLIEMLAGSQSVLRSRCLQIINYIIRFTSQHSLQEFNLHYNFISKVILSLSPDLQTSQIMTIFKCIGSILARNSSLLTEQDRHTLQQKLMLLSNRKALQEQAYRLLTHLDYQYF